MLIMKSMRVNGSMINVMAMDNKKIKMAQFTQAIGSKANNKVRVVKSGLMVCHTKVNLNKV